MTVEEFWKHHADKPIELVHGTPLEQKPLGVSNARLVSTLAFRLLEWTAAMSSSGDVGVNVGFKLAPDSLRGPNVHYVSAGRIPSGEVPESYWELAPDLAVEVVSDLEWADGVMDKVLDFLGAGTFLVWVVSSSTCRVIEYTPDHPHRVFKMGEVLENETVLPGFRLPLEELFR